MERLIVYLFESNVSNPSVLFRIHITADTPGSSQSIPVPWLRFLHKSCMLVDWSSTASGTLLKITPHALPPPFTYIKERFIIHLLGAHSDRSSRRHRLYLSQVDEALVIRILYRFVIPQLVLNRVQNEPALLPALQ